MKTVRDKASVSEKTVQKVASDSVNSKPSIPRPRKARRVYGTRVRSTRWSDGLDPLLIDYVKRMKIAPSLIETRSSVEIIIHNISPHKGGRKK